MLIEEDFDIKNHTSYKIGGKIKEICFPENMLDFENLLKSKKDYIVVGNLSNTLISSFGYDKTLILTTKLNNIEINGSRVKAEAGVKGPMLAQYAAKNGLSGFEFMIGFPGSVGGEVYMNAGAHGQTISDRFYSAKVFDGKSIITLKRDDMKFEYRKSICSDKNYIVLEAEFDLVYDNPENINNKMNEYLQFRKNHQPTLATPNCGSIFKNPEGQSAGKLLDECNVKGLKIGGAKVWEGHANFIINENNATSTDVLLLMCEMKKRVLKNFGIELLPEIKFLGDKNEEEVKLCEYLKVK